MMIRNMMMNRLNLFILTVVCAYAVDNSGSFHFALQRAVKSVEASSVAAHREGHGAAARRAQDEFPIYGDYRHLAYYYADIFVGSKRQRFTVIADTGSSLTEVPCFDCANCGSHMNPRYKPAESTHAIAQMCPNCPGGRPCSSGSHPGQCTYSQAYAEGSQISGVLYRDQVYLGADGDATEGSRTAEYAVPFIIGCGLSEGGLFNSQEADGIMGLGMGELSMTHALWSSEKIAKKIFSLCLNFNGGAMTFGIIETRLHTQPIQWAQLNAAGFYVVNVVGWALSGADMDANGFNSPHTIVDSGTTFTYVPSNAFRAIQAHINDFCSKPGNCKGSTRSVSGESLCYSIARADISTFPSVTISLTGADGGPVVNLNIAPEHLFVNMGWDEGAYCLAVYDNGNGGGVIGGNAMMGHDIIFDLVQTRLGVAESSCVLDPSWVAKDVSASATPSVSPSQTPSTSESGTASTTPSISRTPSTTATNGTSSTPSAPAISVANKLPSVGALLAGPAASNAALGIAAALLVAILIFCLVRGCEISIGGISFKIQGRYPASTQYGRLGARRPESVKAAAPGSGTLREEDDEEEETAGLRATKV
jgi:hypothetical protein